MSEPTDDIPPRVSEEDIEFIRKAHEELDALRKRAEARRARWRLLPPEARHNLERWAAHPPLECPSVEDFDALKARWRARIADELKEPRP